MIKDSKSIDKDSGKRKESSVWEDVNACIIDLRAILILLFRV